MQKNTNKEVVIHVNKLHKTFKKQNEIKNFKEILLSFFRQKTKNRRKGVFVAIDDVSFDIYEGEFFGIVGRNGSGKSTLLKILAGVYAPTSGEVDVRKSLTPFIELGVGFNPELSGRDNVYLNAALLGFSRSETDLMYDDIVEFSELGEFMEEKLRNYSSGMQVRLAFSIAIKAKSDILLIDEVLAVGDTAFQHKCINYFKRIRREGRTVVFVTHDMASVERFCDRVLVLDKSKFIGIMKPKQATKIYQQINAESELDGSADFDGLGESKMSVRLADGLIKLLEVGKKNKPIICGEPLEIRITLDPNKLGTHIIDGLVSMSFYDGSGQFAASLDSDKFRYSGTGREMVVKLPTSPFISGVYTAYVSIYQQQSDGEFIVVDAYDAGARFVAVPPNGGGGSGQLFLHDSKWRELR